LIRSFLSIGSNQGKRFSNISNAVGYIGETDGIEIIRVSSVYETEPWGVKDQPEFLNIVVEINTSLGALELLKKCKGIEKLAGRTESGKWGPRIVDIDILLYGDRVIDTDRLTIPHAFLTQRRFVLIPFAEIDPECIIPGEGITISRALASCIDKGEVSVYKKQLEAPNY